jgi:hypothetical protein
MTGSTAAARKARRKAREPRAFMPFGSPDGSNANLHELIRDFVEVNDATGCASLATPASDHSARLLVGKMGVGKTVYLRRSRAAAADDDSLHVDDVRRDIPSTADVVRVCQGLLEHEVDEIWEHVWRRATCRAAISHVLRSRDLRDRPESLELRLELEDFRRLVPEFRTRRSVYSQVQDIIDTHGSRSQLRSYLFHDGWADVETLLGDALHHSPPVCFYLDSADDQFSRAPMFWLKCQRGLFTHAMSLLEDTGLRRVHVMASLRDIVYSDVLKGTHAGRYRNAPHIRVLDWDLATIRQFLHAKIERLSRSQLMAPGHADPIHAWLGRTEVVNCRRDVVETIEHYLLRHTRLIPRDVVALGNLLCDVVAAAKEDGRDRVGERALRRAVATAAKGFAEQQLTVCTDQIAADMIPPHGATAGYDAFYTGSSQYGKGIGGYGDAVHAALLRAIAAAGHDRLGGQGLGRVEESFAEEFPDYPFVLDVLWQNGLLGYRDRDSQEPEEIHFFAAAGVDDFRLPRGRCGYAFHPCVMHAVELAPAGAPVRGFATEREDG